jgi:hypothetical protein
MSYDGEGGLGKRNPLQLVHSCFDLQQALPNIFKTLWNSINSAEDGLDYLIKRPVLTRWWFVGCAVIHLLDNWLQWSQRAQSVVQWKGSKTCAGKIASSEDLLMNKPVVRFQCELIAAFTKSIF